MLRDEFLTRMIVNSAPPQQFEDWAEVLTNFANCVAMLSPKLTTEECDRLVATGAAFYRTLARAEEYRKTGVRPH